MTKAAFAALSPCLVYLRAQNTQPWDAGAIRFYFSSLQDIPDEDVPALVELISKTEEWRPAPARILELWRSLHPSVFPTAVEVYSKLTKYVRRYGANAVPHPDVQGIRIEGAPLELTEIERRVVDSMGGWRNYCEEETLESIFRSQVEKHAEAVIAQAKSESKQVQALNSSGGPKQIEGRN